MKTSSEAETLHMGIKFRATSCFCFCKQSTGTKFEKKQKKRFAFSGYFQTCSECQKISGMNAVFLIKWEIRFYEFP
jgi:hypothetical protein